LDRFAFGATVRLALALTIVLVASGCGLVAEGPRVEDGVLDLSGWDFRDEGAVALEGEWQICWNHFVDPASRDCPYGHWQDFPVPRLWSDSGVASPIGPKGVATYRLRIELPKGAMPLALRVGAPMTAYRLFVDGELVARAGEAGETAAATVPRLLNARVRLPEGASRVDLVLHVANFDFRGGGLRRTWYVGTVDGIDRLTARQVLVAVVFATTSIVVGLLFLAQFGFRPSERARAWLGLFSVLVGLRLVPASTSDLPQFLLPWASFDLLIRLEYVNSALLMASSLQYVRTRLPGVMPPRTTGLLLLACLALVPIQLLAPLPIVLETLSGIVMLAPVLIGLVVVEYGRARRRGVVEAGPTMWAAIVFGVGVAHDIVRTYTGAGARIELFPYFVIVWLALESYFLLRSYAQAHTTVEALSEELDDANYELKQSEDAIVRFVPFDLVRMLGKQSIRDVEAGDHARTAMTVLHLVLRSAPSPADLASRAEGFDVANEYLGRIDRVLHRHGGFVHEYRDTGLEVFFPGGVADAVAAGRAMLAEERVGFPFGESRIPVQSDAAIGIDYGPIVIGMFGSAEQLLKVVSGAPLASAPRIAEIALDTEARLLISDRALALLPNEEAFEPQAVATLPGDAASERLTLYALSQPRDESGERA
jgi:class 3 adenylate cyclase